MGGPGLRSPGPPQMKKLCVGYARVSANAASDLGLGSEYRCLPALLTRGNNDSPYVNFVKKKGLLHEI